MAIRKQDVLQIWFTIQSWKTFLLFFTTNTGIQFSSSCSSAQEKLKSSKIRRKGYICTLITCLDLLHITQTFKPHQHIRNYTLRVLLTLLSNLICYVLYVTEIYGIWFGWVFFYFLSFELEWREEQRSFNFVILWK